MDPKSQSIADLAGYPGWLNLLASLEEKEVGILTDLAAASSNEKLLALGRFWQAFRTIKEHLRDSPAFFQEELDRLKSEGLLDEEGRPISSQLAWMERFGVRV